MTHQAGALISSERRSSLRGVAITSPGTTQTPAPSPMPGPELVVRQNEPVLPPSAAIDTAELRKARGAFFTPEPLAW